MFVKLLGPIIICTFDANQANLIYFAIKKTLGFKKINNHRSIIFSFALVYFLLVANTIISIRISETH